MDLKQLQALGAFVPRALTMRTLALKRPVLDPDGDPDDPTLTGEFVDDTMDVWIRKRTSADFLEMVRAPDRDKAHVAILRCVCNEDGSEVFPSLEACKQIREWLFGPLMVAVNEVNDFGLKNSKPKTNSGASLPSSSAVPSRKLRRAARNKSGPSGSPTGTSAGH